MLWLWHHGGGAHGEAQLAPVHDYNHIFPGFCNKTLVQALDVKCYARSKQLKEKE